MTCIELGGACNKEITEESKKHGMKMLHKGDKEHLEAMNRMKELMKQPNLMEQWYKEREEKFNSLPEI